MFRYLPIEEQLSTPDLGRYRSFGIAAFQVLEGRWEKKAFASDVSADEVFVSRLAQRCTQAQLNPIHLRDVVEDTIGR